jgi:hypothetical protein
LLEILGAQALEAFWKSRCQKDAVELRAMIIRDNDRLGVQVPACLDGVHQYVSGRLESFVASGLDVWTLRTFLIFDDAAVRFLICKKYCPIARHPSPHLRNVRDCNYSTETDKLARISESGAVSIASDSTPGLSV